MRRLDQRALAFVQDTVPPGPETLHVDLTNTCNFDCVFCWHYSPLRAQRVGMEWARTRLPTDLAEAALRDAAAIGTSRVLFSGGGEPLLHPAAYEILELCRELGLKTTLISNLSHANVDRLQAAGIDKLLANCSAASEAVYQVTHPNQRAGAWPALLDRIATLATSCAVTLVFVVTRDNAHEIGPALDLAAKVGAMRVQYKLADLHGSLQQAAISAGDRALLLEQLPELETQAAALGVATTLEAFGRELRGARQGLDFVRDVGCYVGWYYARIAANGAVYACCKNVPIGNLNEASFAEIWRGASYSDFRAHTRARDFTRWPNACAACGNLSLNVRAARLIQEAAVGAQAMA